MSATAKCAKRISTRFLSSRDLANAFVLIFRRATSRASSISSRTIRREGMLGQHFCFNGHVRQVVTEAKYRIP